MARLARIKSETGIYHVMLRGIDKGNIFLVSRDYEKFIDSIKKAQEKTKFSVYAYCLMTNHVHILIKTNLEEIGDTIRRIAVSYAQYHNIKNGRTGHLFQNRFRSEAVDNDEYFLTVIRYIHQNPVKAGIVKYMTDYKWSSFNEYINGQTVLIEPQFVLNYFYDINDFKKYNSEDNYDMCLEYSDKKRWIDEELKEFISLSFDIVRLSELDIESRNEMIINIKESTGATNRQLSRVLNIGRGAIEKIK